MSDQRRVTWRSGRLVLTPLSGFWAVSLTEHDPSIPNLPIESPPPAGGGSVVLDDVDGGIGAGTITSAGAAPNGDNRLMLACAVGKSAADDLKYGGSGGTSLTKISSDIGLLFSIFQGNVWAIDPGPTGSTTAWVDFGTSDTSSFSVIYLEGVDQTTPYTTAQTAGPTSSGTPSKLFTGLTEGQKVYSAVVFAHLPTALSGFTPNGSTTVVRSDFGTSVGERQPGTMWLSGTADAGGEVTLGGTLTSGFDTGEWYMYGFGINAAAGGAQEGPVGVSIETDTAFALARLQSRAVGLASDTETAFALSAGASGAVGMATEADTAFALSQLQIRAAGLSSEADTAFALAGAQLRTVGLSVEADTSFASAPVQLRTTGLASETDTSFSLTAGAGAPVGLATETDSAFAMAGAQLRSAGLTSEADTALARSAVLIRATGVAVETDSAFALLPRQIGATSFASEADTAFALAPAGMVSGPVGLAVETDAAFALESVGAPGGSGAGSSSWGGLLHKHKLLQAFKDKQERDEAVKALPKVTERERVTLRKSARKLIASEPVNYKELETRVAADLANISMVPGPSHLDWLLYFLRVEAHNAEQMRLMQEEEDSAIMAILLAITE